MSSLPDIILPSFRRRTRSFLDEDRAARRALKMQDGIGMLDFAVEDPSEDPAEVFSVVQEALEIAVGVIANADDSLGMLSEVVEELIELHAKSAQRAKPAPMELADWFIAFHENNEVDYFVLDPVAYSTVLGEDGLVRVRAWAENADIIRRKYMEKRFAVLDQDVDAIIRTHLAEGSYAVYFEETAKALEEIGKHEAAWEYAKRGTESDPDWQARSCGTFWVELARDHFPEREEEVAAIVLNKWPDPLLEVLLYPERFVEP